MRRLLVLLCVVLGVLGVVVGAQVAAASPSARPVGRAEPAAPAPVTHLHTYAVRSGATVHWQNPPASTFDHVVVRYARGYTAPTTSTLGKRARLTGPKANLARLGGLTDDTVYTVAVWTVNRHGRRSAAGKRTFTSGVLRGPRGVYVGRVVDDKGHPLLNADVSATSYSGSGSVSRTARTDANGRFRLRLVPEAWSVDIGGQHISGGDSDPTGYVGTGTGIVVHSDQTVRAGDITLTPGGAISGRVTDAGGAPLAGVEPTAFPVQTYVQDDDSGGVGIFFSIAFDDSDSVFTDSAGDYTVKGISNSTAMRVCMLTTVRPVTGGAADQAGYSDRCVPSSVAVARGAAQTEPDLALDSGVGGEIAGTVTTPTGSGLGSWDVSFEPTHAADTDTFVGDTVTSPDGSYTMAGLEAGRYRVCASLGVQPNSSRTGYAPRCHRGLVTVQPGGRTTADVELALGAAVTGKVTGPHGVPIAGVEVQVVGGHRSSGSDVTDATGHYRVKGLATGEQIACFATDDASAHKLPTGALSACYGHRIHFGVRAGSVRNGVDVQLRQGGAVSGVVRDSTGQPVPFALVEIDGVSSKHEEDGGVSQSDAHGRYVARGLDAAEYRVCFTFFDQDLTQQTSCHRGRVRVELGRTTSGVNGVIPLIRSIVVTVHDAAGHPVAGVDATAFASCRECNPEPLFSSRTGVRVDASSTTDGTGVATLRTLKPGRYAVCLFAYYGATTSGTPPNGYADRCSGSTFTVTVRAGRTAAITETLSDAGTVSGTVTDGAGHPLSGVLVHVTHSAADDYESDFFPGDFDYDPFDGDPPTDSITRADGSYTIRSVQPGTSTVCADATAAHGPDAGGYFSQCLGGKVGSTSGGAGVTVTADTDSSGNDLALTPASGISGTVIGPGGRADGDAVVLVFARRNPDDIAQQQPNDDGTYTVTQLPAGTYDVCVLAFGRHEQSQCYRDVAWKNADEGTNPPLGRATLVSTTAGTVTGGIDFHIHR